jgi:hypothetical protein
MVYSALLPSVVLLHSTKANFLQASPRPLPKVSCTATIICLPRAAECQEAWRKGGWLERRLRWVGGSAYSRRHAKLGKGLSESRARIGGQGEGRLGGTQCQPYII